MPDVLAMLTSERDKLNRAIEALGGEIEHAITRLAKKARRKTISAEARAKMAAGQRARWAKAKMKSAEKSIRKFTMSAEAKARISAAKKAWWKAKRKAEKIASA